MAGKKSITFEEFIERYGRSELFVAVQKSSAGALIRSDMSLRKFRWASLVWTWAGIILELFAIAFAWWLVHWLAAIGAFILGVWILSAARQSDIEFVHKNMLEDRDFWLFAIVCGGATVKDDDGNIYVPPGIDLS